MSKTWQQLLADGIEAMLARPEILDIIDAQHLCGTPERVVKMFQEMFSGCTVDTQKLLLSARFDSDGYVQMIHVPQIPVYSMCAHHLLPFIGKAHFAYVPGEKIVGLSKIPRLVNAFSRRPQVQEKLTSEIVTEFWNALQPRGCAVKIRARHCCMECRGVKATTAYMETTDLRGSFLTDEKQRSEFLMAASAHTGEFA